MSFGDYIGRNLDGELSEEEGGLPSTIDPGHEDLNAGGSPGQDSEFDINLTGTWVVDRSRSYPIHDLLKAMGVSWVTRKMFPSETTLRIQQCPVLQVNESGTAFNHKMEIPLDGKAHEARDALGDNVTVTAYLDQETQAVIVETDHPRRLGGCRTVDIRQLARDGMEMKQEIQLWAGGQLVHACRRTWSKLQEDKPTTYDGLLAGIGRMRLRDPKVKAALAEGAKAEVLCSVYENQRFYSGVGWKSGLLASDGVSRWSDEWDQPSESRDQINATLPHGWHWLGPWRVDKGQAEAVAGAHSQKVITDAEGWSYAREFSVNGPRSVDWQGKFVPGETMVRRRRWVRSRAPISGASDSTTGGSSGAGLRSLDSPTGDSGAIAIGGSGAGGGGGGGGGGGDLDGVGKNGGMVVGSVAGGSGLLVGSLGGPGSLVGSVSGGAGGEHHHLLLRDDPDPAAGAGVGGAGDEDEETEGIAAYMLRQEKNKAMMAAQEQAARMNAAIASGSSAPGGAPLEPTQRELALEAENERLANEGQQFLVQLIQQKQTNQELRQQLLQLMAGQRDEDLEDLEESSERGTKASSVFSFAGRDGEGGTAGQDELLEAKKDGEEVEETDDQLPPTPLASSSSAPTVTTSSMLPPPTPSRGSAATGKSSLREQLARVREQAETEQSQLKRQLRKRKQAYRKLKKHVTLLEENCRAYEEKLAEYDRDYMEMTRRLGDSSVNHNKLAQDRGRLRDENIRLSRIVEDLKLEGQALREHHDKLQDLVQTLTEDKRQIVGKHMQEMDALKQSLRQQISERTHHLHMAMKEARRQQGLAQEELLALQTRTDLRITQLEEHARENLQAINAELQRAHRIAADQIQSEKRKREQAEADLETLQLELYAETQKVQRLQASLQEARAEREEALRQSQTLTDLLGQESLSEARVLDLEVRDLRHSLAESHREKEALEKSLAELTASQGRAGRQGAAVELQRVQAEKLKAEKELRAEIARLRLQLLESRERAVEAEESEAAMAAALEAAVGKQQQQQQTD